MHLRPVLTSPFDSIKRVFPILRKLCIQTLGFFFQEVLKNGGWITQHDVCIQMQRVCAYGKHDVPTFVCCLGWSCVTHTVLPHRNTTYYYWSVCACAMPVLAWMCLSCVCVCVCFEDEEDTLWTHTHTLKSNSHVHVIICSTNVYLQTCPTHVDKY